MKTTTLTESVTTFRMLTWTQAFSSHRPPLPSADRGFATEGRLVVISLCQLVEDRFLSAHNRKTLLGGAVGALTGYNDGYNRLQPP